MTDSNRLQRLAAASLLVIVGGCTGLSYQNQGPAVPTPTTTELQGPTQAQYAKYRTPIETTVLDRRFETVQAMYLANELNETGFPFFERAAIAGLAGFDPDFVYMTTVESYWYSRYNMSALVSESRMGLHTVYGPYVTEWALREGRSNINRDRGEYVVGNRGAMLKDIIPMYLARTGFPRRFEDGGPSMLHFASGDPHYQRPLDTGTRFESTENVLRNDDLRGLYGESLPDADTGNDMWTPRINYRENFLTLRWNHGDMEHVIDMGAEGQVLVKEALWAQHFFQQNHHQGEFLGIDPEQGYRGAMLNLMAVNKMLMLKGAMLYDGDRLGGADPRNFTPGAQYFPHRINVRMRLVGDLPPRPEEFTVADASSQLFDQASLLWGLSEYYHFADPAVEDSWDAVFGDNPPYDGSIMEQKYIVLAEGLADMIVQNLDAMHSDESGVLASEWLPEEGRGQFVKAEDLGMALIGLSNYARRLPETARNAFVVREMLATQANFMADVMESSDGQVAATLDLNASQALSGPATLLAQSMAVRGLMAAYDVLEDERLFEAAKRAYSFMNTRLWAEEFGVYRSHLDAEVTEYTPMIIGSAIGAMREMALATKDEAEMERIMRFWVQGVNQSGIQQAEYEETGEKNPTLADMDGDGIPHMAFGDGKNGIAPVFASKVSIQTPLRGRTVAPQNRPEGR